MAGLGPARKHSKFDVDTPGEAAEAGCKAGRKGKIFGERMELRDIASFEIVAQGKSAATAAMLLGALRGHFVFEKVDDVHAEEVVAAMSRVDLEEEELFYIQSRGLSPATARSLLVAGFGLDIASKLPGKDLRDHTEKAVRDALDQDDVVMVA